MKIVLDISSFLCNAKCVWCYCNHNYKNLGFMSIENVKKFISLNPDICLEITLSGFGEPLINPNFFEIIDLLHEKYNLIVLTTNFSTKLTEQQIKKLEKYFLGLWVDAGGVTKESRYQNMKIENDFFFENKKIFDKLNSSKIYYSYIETKYNTNEDIKHSYFSIKSDEYYKAISCNKKIDYVNSQIYFEEECTEENFTILSNGEILLCCDALYPDYLIGNAFEVPILEIISDEKYKNAKQLVKEKKYSHLCKYCR